jgi:IS30 family transposase
MRWSQWFDATPSVRLLLKGGVYDPREIRGAFCGAADLKIQYPADESMCVSHETIHRSLFIQARGVLKKELLGHLRSKRRIRRSQHSRILKDSRDQIVDAISIRERPAEIEDRAVPGHWGGDLNIVVPANFEFNSHVAKGFWAGETVYFDERSAK